MGKVNFGVFLPSYAFKNETPPNMLFNRLRDVVLESERLGYHSVWLDDHLMYGASPMLECWTTLSALASATAKIRLGTMVTSNAFRNPALLAKMTATVDVISGGRLELGVGAGVQQEEHDSYGFSFPKPNIRIARLKESVEIIKKMWVQEKASYNGKYYCIADAICEPKPLQKPHPPITLGGSGEKYMLKVTAQHADRFDFGYFPTMELYKHKLQVLENHCKSIGRKFAEIEKSCWPAGQILLSQNQRELEDQVKQFKPKNMRRADFEKFSLVGSPDECAAKLSPYLDLGVTYFMLFFADLPETNSLRLFAETVLKQMG